MDAQVQVQSVCCNVDYGSEVVELGLHILNICEKAVRARCSKGQSEVLLKLV